MASTPKPPTGNAGSATPAKRKRAAPGQGPRRLAAEKKRQEALTLRMAGLSYEEIAKRVGYANKGTAWKVVEQALKEIRHEKADQVLELELARLDRVTQPHFVKAAGGDIGHTKVLLQIMDRRAKYLSLDNPAMTDAVADGVTLLGAMAAQLVALPDSYVDLVED